MLRPAIRNAGRPFGGCFPARNAPFSWRSFAFENALTLRGQPSYVALTVLIGSPPPARAPFFRTVRRLAPCVVGRVVRDDAKAAATELGEDVVNGRRRGQVGIRRRRRCGRGRDRRRARRRRGPARHGGEGKGDRGPGPRNAVRHGGGMVTTPIRASGPLGSTDPKSGGSPRLRAVEDLEDGRKRLDRGEGDRVEDELHVADARVR